MTLLQLSRLSMLGLALLLACGAAWAADPPAAAETQAEPAEAARPYEEGRHGAGELRYINGVPFLFVEGTPEEIGEQTAMLVVDSVRPLLGLPRKLLEDHGVGLAWPLIARVGRGMVRTAPQRYSREIEAAAKAVGLSDAELDAVYVANAMVELRRIGGCSALLVEPDRSATGEMLFGRNFDFPSFGSLDRLTIVTVCRPKGHHAFVAVGYPGLFGVVSGMNEKGLAVATLDVYSSKDGSVMFNPQGTPLALTYRRILEECKTVEEAEALLKESKRTTWMNLAVCDVEKAVVFEITPDNVVSREPEEQLLACTNHFRTPELSTGQNCWRYAEFEKAWEREKLGLDDVAEAMHLVNQGEMTLQTMIFEPKSLRLHLAIGKPPVSALPLKTFDLAPMFQRAAAEEAQR